MAILSIRHLTRYRYTRPVGLGEHRMMLRPLESYDQRVLEWTLAISPEPVLLRHAHDVFGNCVGTARFGARTEELVFESRAVLDHRPVQAFADADLDLRRPGDAPFSYSAEDMPDLLRCIERAHADPDGALERWARGFARRGVAANLPRLLADMTQAIHSDFRYATRLHGPPQSPLETLASRTGTCRDFAVLMMEAARSLGLAAQFVSGYIYTPPRRFSGLTSVGGGHTHAWLRIYLPACGWVEFDPTNGIVGNVDLVRVAIARDPRQALPLYGAWSGQAADFLGMDVEVEVTSDEDADLQRAADAPAEPPRCEDIALTA